MNRGDAAAATWIFRGGDARDAAVAKQRDSVETGARLRYAAAAEIFETACAKHGIAPSARPDAYRQKGARRRRNTL